MPKQNQDQNDALQQIMGSLQGSSSVISNNTENSNEKKNRDDILKNIEINQLAELKKANDTLKSILNCTCNNSRGSGVGALAPLLGGLVPALVAAATGLAAGAAAALLFWKAWDAITGDNMYEIATNPDTYNPVEIKKEMDAAKAYDESVDRANRQMEERKNSKEFKEKQEQDPRTPEGQAKIKRDEALKGNTQKPIGPSDTEEPAPIGKQFNPEIPPVTPPPPPPPQAPPELPPTPPTEPPPPPKVEPPKLKLPELIDDQPEFRDPDLIMGDNENGAYSFDTRKYIEKHWDKTKQSFENFKKELMEKIKNGDPEAIQFQEESRRRRQKGDPLPFIDNIKQPELKPTADIPTEKPDNFNQKNLKNSTKAQYSKKEDAVYLSYNDENGKEKYFKITHDAWKAEKDKQKKEDKASGNIDVSKWPDSLINDIGIATFRSILMNNDKLPSLVIPIEKKDVPPLDAGDLINDQQQSNKDKLKTTPLASNKTDNNMNQGMDILSNDVYNSTKVQPLVNKSSNSNPAKSSNSNVSITSNSSKTPDNTDIMFNSAIMVLTNPEPTALRILMDINKTYI